MIAFGDTSAFLAVLGGDDRNHSKAASQWGELVDGDTTMVCTSYVLAETTAPLQSRFELQAVREFREDLAPLLTLAWVEPELRQAGMTGVLTASRREWSLTDNVSFEVMRRRGIRHAFAFDRHFRE